MKHSVKHHLNKKYGFVYAIKFSNGQVKIGKTKDFNERLKQIEGINNHHTEVEDYVVSKLIESYGENETRLHYMFSANKISGEYFNADYNKVKEVILNLTPANENDITDYIDTMELEFKDNCDKFINFFYKKDDNKSNEIDSSSKKENIIESGTNERVIMQERVIEAIKAFEALEVLKLRNKLREIELKEIKQQTAITEVACSSLEKLRDTGVLSRESIEHFMNKHECNSVHIDKIIDLITDTIKQHTRSRVMAHYKNALTLSHFSLQR